MFADNIMIARKWMVCEQDRDVNARDSQEISTDTTFYVSQAVLGLNYCILLRTPDLVQTSVETKILLV